MVEIALLNYDELTNFTCRKIEQTLSGRPMTYLSVEHNDEAITPSHLLYGRNINTKHSAH